MVSDRICRGGSAENTNLPVLGFVMSGGCGSRLWPLSRMDKPKQFHKLTGDICLLAETLCRLHMCPVLMQEICIIGAKAHFSLLKEAVAEYQKHTRAQSQHIRMILEPVARNTAAVAALAVASALSKHDDALILLCPADHEISTTEQFAETIAQGIPAAVQGDIVTFGLLPERPETGYGYIETGADCESGYEVVRFTEKPDAETALSFIRQGRFFWNSGLFLSRASVLREAFEQYAPEIWRSACAALQNAECNGHVSALSETLYAPLPSISFDHAIMEKISRCRMIPAQFRWGDLGSWQALWQREQEQSAQGDDGNVVSGNVIAHDCRGSYVHSEDGLIAVSGLTNMAVIATRDATLIAPVAQSRQMQALMAQMTQQQRPELYYQKPTLSHGAHSSEIHDWLFETVLPLWAKRGVDYCHGGFYEGLSLQGRPLSASRRTRTMARQIYAFARSSIAGWDGDAATLIAHGLLFMQAKGRSRRGGWVQLFHADGRVADAQENFYDQSCMLLALAYAYQSGHNQALQLAQETFAFLDNALTHNGGGFYDRVYDKDNPAAILTSNAHMHYLEACLAWHDVSGDEGYLKRAQSVVELCSQYFFDSEYWALGEFFTPDWKRASGNAGEHTEPGHYFEWAALLCDYSARTADAGAQRIASRLYTSALSKGTNRETGLAYNILSREGRPLDKGSRSWQQCEGIKAAIMLDGYHGHDLKPEIEGRVANLLRWHIYPVEQGLWIDRVKANGTACSGDVPASILYHLVSALTLYLQFTQNISSGSTYSRAMETRQSLHYA